MAVEQSAETGPDRTTLAAFLAMCFIAGGNVVAIRYLVATHGLDPLWTAALAILAAAACAAEAAIIVKVFPRVHPAMMNAIGMGIGTAIFLVLTVVFDESYGLPEAGAAWAAQVYLVLAGSVGVFLLYLYVLRRWTASAVSYEFVIIPLVGIVLAAWLLDEPITGAFAAGSILVLAGVYLGALRIPGSQETVADTGVVEPAAGTPAKPHRS